MCTYYCSQACQKVAWKDTLAAHRTICDSIKTIAEQLKTAQGGDGSRPYDVKSIKDFDDRCVKGGVDPSAANQVTDYLRKIYGR